MNFKSFIAELKRRHVYNVSVAYEKYPVERDDRTVKQGTAATLKKYAFRF